MLGTEVGEGQQLLAERLETSQTTSHPSAGNECSVWELHLNITTMTAERSERYDVATEATEQLKKAEAEVALQSRLEKAVMEETVAYTAIIAKIQKQLAAECAK